MPKKKTSIGNQIDEKFDTLENKIDKLENKVDDGFKTLFQMHFEQNKHMEAMEGRLNDKLDKILSFVSNLVVTTEGIKQDVSALSERVREHEDKLESLAG
jgi:outer membrane murein-binding lipoprotein Lpp